MTVRFDHVGIVVDDLPAAVAFFLDLGLELEGETEVGGPWVDELIGLDDVRADVAFVKTQDGSGRVELSVFRHPVADEPAPRAPLNVPGIPRVTFVVDDVRALVDRLRAAHGTELVGGIAQYEDVYLYVNVRGPAGVIIGLVQELR
ncbi:VOC family protein [Glycomyces terrestris]|uniref:VOC family protein n=1 Tax=Glycomyces terrestris TaxID=2493553 RepID=A0A426V4U0_9ACTN|nr:VOC family protein [Glycomyces terrestris]RRS01855.1 VOC family protein [Glycomyces terrestris]